MRGLNLPPSSANKSNAFDTKWARFWVIFPRCFGDRRTGKAHG